MAEAIHALFSDVVLTVDVDGPAGFQTLAGPLSATPMARIMAVYRRQAGLGSAVLICLGLQYFVAAHCKVPPRTSSRCYNSGLDVSGEP